MGHAARAPVRAPVPVLSPGGRHRLACCLAGALAAVAACGPARAQEPPQGVGLFQVARLKYAGGGDWYANPSSFPNLLRELQLRTGIPTAPEEATVSLDDEQLYAYPMLCVTGHGTIRPSPGDLQRLRAYLDRGGFLWVDDNYGIDKSFRAMVAELYPDEKLVPLSSRHPIYRAFYGLPGLPKIHEHDGDPAQGFAVMHQGRMAIYYTWSTDIGDGIEDPEVHHDPPDKREAAMKMAINICYYALTQP